MSTLDTTPSPAAPALHIATPTLQNATLCYTPATPFHAPELILNHDQLITSIPSLPAACYTPPITFPAAPADADISLDLSNTSDPTAPSSTPAACSTIPHSLLELTPTQRRALDLLQAGHSITAAARALNIHRVTVQRWKTHHPRFIAELAHRAGVSRLDTSLKAQRALDLAINLLIRQLTSSPRDAQQIALRIISSPRLSRLAASAQSVTLRDTLAQLQQLRAITPSDDAPTPDTLADLVAELDAPIPTDAPQPRKARPRPGKPLPWATPPKPRLSELIATRPPRPELVELFTHYGCTPEQMDLVARRPDITPFDIHYFAVGMELSDGSPSPHTATALVHEGNLFDIGVRSPLNPHIVVKMIPRGLVTRLAGHDLAGYTASSDTSTDNLTLTHPTKPTIILHRSQLWRDTVVAS